MNNELIVYSVNEVMEILKLSRITVLRYIATGQIKAVKIGNQYRIRKESLEEFLDGKKN